MGCGSSKSNKVVPSDTHLEQKEPEVEFVQQETKEVSPPPNNDKKEETEPESGSKTLDTGNDEAPIDRGPTERPKTASISFDVAMEKPRSAKKPKRLVDAQAKGTPTTSKRDIQQKLEQATKRREDELNSKKAALQSDEDKRKKARQALENKKNRAKEKMASKLETVEKKRDKELTARTAAAAQHDQKAKKAKARRHEVAMIEAAQMDTGGEVDNESEDNNNSDTEEPTSEVQNF